MNILCLDDDRDFVFALKNILGKNEMNLTATHGSKEFINALNESKADLCLVDINLAFRGEGKRVIQSIRESRQDSLPIIAMSRNSDQNEINEILNLGANDFISKPLDEFYLTRKIEILKNKDLTNTPMSAVPESKGSATLDIDFVVNEINEKAIIFFSPYFIKKGSEFIFSGPVTEDCYLHSERLKISSTKPKGSGFLMEVVFTDENRDLLRTIKSAYIRDRINAEMENEK